MVYDEMECGWCDHSAPHGWASPPRPASTPQSSASGMSSAETPRPSAPPNSPALLNACRLVVIEKNWDRQWKRMYIFMAPDHQGLADIIRRTLCSQGGYRQYNAPPPATLEREIQDILGQKRKQQENTLNQSTLPVMLETNPGKSEHNHK